MATRDEQRHRRLRQGPVFDDVDGHVPGDLVGVHDYSHDPEVLGRRYGSAEAVAATLTGDRPGGKVLLVDAPVAGTPVVLSEFGGVTLRDGDDSWGYGEVADAEALVERVRALVARVGTASGLVGFCWTQLTDCLQEQNGLAWPDRTPKAPIAELRAAIREE